MLTFPLRLLMVLVVTLGLYTIYDHRKFYFYRDPISACAGKPLIGDPTQIITPSTSASPDTDIEFGEDIFNSTNFDELLQSTLSKHFGDIGGSSLNILDSYGRLSDENTLMQLKSEAKSFLLKSRIVNQLSSLYQDLKALQVQNNSCESMNLTHLNSMYGSMTDRINQLRIVQSSIEEINSVDLARKNRTYSVLTQREWQKSKEESNLLFLEQQLETDNKRQGLTDEERYFLTTFPAYERDIQALIESWEQQRRQTKVSAFEAVDWNPDSIRRTKDVIRLKMKELPLTAKINDLKTSIEELQNINREVTAIVQGFQTEKEQLARAVALGLMDEKEAITMYKKRVESYFLSVKQLVQIKYYVFRKEKVKHSLEELQKEEQKLTNIERYIEISQTIDELSKDYSRELAKYNRLLSMEKNQFDEALRELKDRIQESRARIVSLQSEIDQIRRDEAQKDNPHLRELFQKAAKLKAQLAPEYKAYQREVDATFKKLMNCKTERMKTESKIKQIKDRMKHLGVRTQSYNASIDSLSQILDEKVI